MFTGYEEFIRDLYGRYYPRQSGKTSNTFRLKPEPREGYIDARRDDGCVPLITAVEAPMFTDVEDRQQEELMKELELNHD